MWKFCIAGSEIRWTASGPLENAQLGSKSLVKPDVEPVTVAVVMTEIGSLSLLQPSAGWAAYRQSGSPPGPKSMAPSPSSSRSLEHAGQSGPDGQSSTSSKSPGVSQPGSSG